jgi:hypothetical protein
MEDGPTPRTIQTNVLCPFVVNKVALVVKGQSTLVTGEGFI